MRNCVADAKIIWNQRVGQHSVFKLPVNVIVKSLFPAMLYSSHGWIKTILSVITRVVIIYISRYLPTHVKIVSPLLSNSREPFIEKSITDCRMLRLSRVFIPTIRNTFGNNPTMLSYINILHSRQLASLH